MQARLRLADVGTPLGQLAGQAHRHPHRTARDGRQRFQPRVQRVRRLVQQQRQGVHQLVHAQRQRHGRLDGGGLGIRLGHIQLGRHAFALP